MLNTKFLLVCNISYETADNGLISTFVKRWHCNTNTFHLFVGEMTIMLDDVSSLLHILIVGDFFLCNIGFHINFFSVAWAPWCAEFGDVTIKLRQYHDAHVRLNWLCKVYKKCIVNQKWEYVTKIYLLYLIGSTIFEDKNVTSIDVSYLPLFINLRMCGWYAWEYTNSPTCLTS